MEDINPDQIVSMTLSCANIDQDENGWFALIIDRSSRTKEYIVGRGDTAWGAVQQVHRKMHGSQSSLL